MCYGPTPDKVLYMPAMNPVYVVLRPIKFRDVDFLMRHRRLIGALLGLTLSSDPGRAWTAYMQKVRALRRLFVERCVREKGGRTCIYKYSDEVTQTAFMRNPVLDAMRGTVLRWHDNGEADALAFPFAKFFNMGELGATEAPPRAGFRAYEKLDGTLVSCWRDTDGELRCSTRGLLDNMKVLPGRVRAHVVPGRNQIVEAFLGAVDRATLDGLVREGYTVMFELVGSVPASRCPDVLRCLDRATAYLLARREGNGPVEYVSHPEFPGPRVFTGSLGELVESVKSVRDMEGMVLHYPGLSFSPLIPWWDYMVKIKSPVYVMRSEVLWYGGGKVNYKSLARLVIVTEAPDDIVAAFPEERDFIYSVYRGWLRVRDAFLELAERVDAETLAADRATRWLASLVKEARRRGASPIKRYVIKGMPRTRDGVPRYLERIAGILESLAGRARHREGEKEPA